MKLTSEELKQANIMKTGPTTIFNEKELKTKIDSILKIFKTYGLMDLFINNKIIMAGGAITRISNDEPFNSSHSDIDFYFKDKIYISKLLMDIEAYNESRNTLDKLDLSYKSANAYTYTFRNYKFQFIILPFMIHEDPRNLINSFDFSICQVAYDFEFDDNIYSSNFLKDISYKEIHFNMQSKHPMTSLVRLDKYKIRGFFISNFELLKIMFSIQNLNFNTYSDVVDAICGISTSYYEEFVELLKSEQYKNRKYNVNEFFELYDQFIIAQKVLKKLTE